MMNMKRKHKGFTLIELMIVVTIIAILAAVGYPSYTKYVLRGKRTEGRTALLDAAARLERYYSDNNQYAALATANITTPTETGKYNLGIVLANTNQNYTLTATPTFTDDDCEELTITNAGVKGSGTGNADCWRR
jgi:type IV pilus assembly protein PilE